jgi:hypothetical protein
MPENAETAGDNHSFVTLMLVAQEEPEIRDTLAAILCQPSARRKYELHKLIGSMKAQGADADFVSAIEALLDDQVAETAYELVRVK